MLRRASLTVLFVILVPAAVEAHDHHHHHSSHSSGGDGCGSSHASSSRPSTPAPSPTHKVVFVTATSYAGAVGGLAAADSFCQSSASERGLPGTYRAWLSDASTNAVDRIDDVGPWYTTGGGLAFASKAALQGAPSADLLDENGDPLATSTGAWTGSDVTGSATTQNCEGWTNATAGATATTGSTFAGDTEWGGGGAPLGCDAKAPLICFQQ